MENTSDETTRHISLLGNVIAKRLHDGLSLHELSSIVMDHNKGWEQYVGFSTEKYKRQLVTRNDSVDVVVISWNVDQHSGLHDHPSNGCIMHVVQGQLQEDIYVRETTDNNKFSLSKSKIIQSGDISFIQGHSGIHNIINCNVQSVSIHVYSPPNYKLTYYNP